MIQKYEAALRIEDIPVETSTTSTSSDTTMFNRSTNAGEIMSGTNIYTTTIYN
jgi:hypothetical protein